MPKLYSLDQASAQARADDMHARMLATSQVYTADVARFNGGGPGGTARWCIPRQDMSVVPIGQTSVPLSALWFCDSTPRCDAVLTAAERSGLVQDGVVGTALNVVALAAQAQVG